VFPDSQHVPSKLAQRAVDAAVAGLGREFVSGCARWAPASAHPYARKLRGHTCGVTISVLSHCVLPPEGGVALGPGCMLGAACRAVASREGGPCQKFLASQAGLELLGFVCGSIFAKMDPRRVADCTQSLPQADVRTDARKTAGNRSSGGEDGTWC